jgi:hypothetical protein
MALALSLGVGVGDVLVLGCDLGAVFEEVGAGLEVDVAGWLVGGARAHIFFRGRVVVNIAGIGIVNKVGVSIVGDDNKVILLWLAVSTLLDFEGVIKAALSLFSDAASLPGSSSRPGDPFSGGGSGLMSRSCVAALLLFLDRRLL